MAGNKVVTTSNQTDNETCNYGDSEIIVLCMSLCVLIIVSLLACVFRRMFQNMFTGNIIITYLTTNNVRNNIQMAPLERTETITGSLAIKNMMRNIEISQEHTDSTVYDCTQEVISRVKAEAKMLQMKSRLLQLIDPNIRKSCSR
ncbi:hypothetical protein DPMN_186827 [Dreissena polymorpha]|uniref:Uncharacterized protein n=1 Tax=Dreissena polymorpha TaxID=45954 RepID=A0A9D4I8I0_DREPO|nr:hypothetical protein DPMN_186827 [Dreissena polymorpha]